VSDCDTGWMNSWVLKPSASVNIWKLDGWTGLQLGLKAERVG